MNIASREDILKIQKTKKQVYSPDLSYLKDAHQTSLAGRLSKPILHTQREKKRTQGEEAKLSTPGSTTETKKEPPDFIAINQKRKEALLEKERERLEREREIEKRIAAHMERHREKEMAAKGTPYSLSTKKTKSNIFFKCREPPDVTASITQRRIEARLEREKARKMAIKGIPYSLSTKKSNAYIFFKGREFDETFRTVQDNADKLSSVRLLFDSSGSHPHAQSAKKPSPEIPDDELSPSALKRRQERRLRESGSSLPFARSAKKPSTEIPDDELSPSALKRRQELRLRESRSSQDSQSLSLDEESGQSGNMKSETATPSIDTAEPEEEVVVEEEEEEEYEYEYEEDEEDVDPTIQAPEFIGPELISETIDRDFGIVQYRPFATRNDHDSVEVSDSPIYRFNPQLIGSLVGGDYSDYTSLSSSISNSTLPTALTVVNTAEEALSCQQDYDIPQRKQAIKIVEILVKEDPSTKYISNLL